MRTIYEQLKKATEDYNVEIKVNSDGMIIDVDSENENVSDRSLIDWLVLESANFEIITQTVRDLKARLNKQTPDHLKLIK